MEFGIVKKGQYSNCTITEKLMFTVTIPCMYFH